ncbi:30554_t:CDS:2, partial [Racocetra persica]
MATPLKCAVAAHLVAKNNVPIKGTCEKCKSSNQVIFEPRLKKVNPIDREVFTNYLCADCYCQEEGISNPSPTNNKKPTSPPPSDNLLEAIEKGENINVDFFSDLTPHSKAFLKALQQVKRGEDINVSDAVLSWEEKEQLNKIKDEVRAKQRKNSSSEGKDKGLPGPVIGIIVIGVVGMEVESVGHHFLSSLPVILNKAITNRRIEYIKAKLEKSNIQVKELEDYLNQKLLDNNYSDWENQMKS